MSSAELRPDLPDPLEALLRRARAGDREAAGSVAREVEDDLRRVISRRIARGLRRRIDTHDVLQSTLMAVVDGLPKFEFRDRKGFEAWARIVAENHARMAARHHRAQKRDAFKHADLPTRGPVSPHTSPTQAAVRSERTGDLREAIAALPDEERRIVELRTYEGRGFREIAAELDLADTHRARYLFRRALQRMAGMVLPRDDGAERPSGAGGAGDDPA